MTTETTKDSPEYSVTRDQSESFFKKYSQSSWSSLQWKNFSNKFNKSPEGVDLYAEI